MRQPTRLHQVGLGLLAVILGLIAAEGIARIQSDGAFPHANFYVPDDDLGVRLEPGATMRFQLGDNPVSDIRVNADGYRGEDWPLPGKDEILVVGDSQVFGLGVEGDETFSARLAEETGRTVLNGGVPTYGPAEYAAVALEVARSRPVSQVIFTINMSNDLFELERPNRERHAVWDGWAVRMETAPESVVDFPGRQWLFRHSHLVYAARRLMAARGPQLDPSGAPSEGGWEDLVASSSAAEAAEAATEEPTGPAGTEVRELDHLRASASEAAARVDDELRRAMADADRDEDRSEGWMLALEWGVAHGHPGDIVGEDYAEASRSVSLTAGLIRKAARHRAALIDRLRGDEELDAALQREQEARAAVEAVERSASAARGVPSVMTPFLTRLRTDLAAEGVELVVLVLPLDLQVDEREWAKYGAEPMDMTGTLALNRDIVDDATGIGMRALDVTPALAAVGAGAFLDGDLHMTARGHAAVAESVAAMLAGPRPLAQPAPGLPDGRTGVPSANRWIQTPEAVVRGSSKAHCETVRIDEWLRVACLREAGLVPTGVEVLKGGVPDTMTLRTRDAATLVTPIRAGQEFQARFHWTAHHQDLTVRWEEDRPVMAFGPRSAPGRAAQDDPLEGRLCACQAEVTGEQVCENRSWMDDRPDADTQDRRGSAERILATGWVDPSSCTSTCRTVLGEVSQGCMDGFADDCEGLLRCVAGEPGFAVACPDGQARVAGARQCRTLCNEDRPCATGSCVQYQGAGICVSGAG